MPHYKLLVGYKCYLSPVQAEDAEKWAAWFNDLDVTLPLGDEAYTVTGLDVHREDVLQTMRGRDPLFSIVRLDSDELIGRCLLFGINRVDRSGMLGILIGEKSCWNQGYGTERHMLDGPYNDLWPWQYSRIPEVLGTGRGGIEQAEFFEWGGRDRNGTDQFARDIAIPFRSAFASRRNATRGPPAEDEGQECGRAHGRASAKDRGGRTSQGPRPAGQAAVL